MCAVMAVGQVAETFGVHAWQVRRLFERGLLPAAERLGPYRVIREADLPAVELALKNAGYLRLVDHITRK